MKKPRLFLVYLLLGCFVMVNAPYAQGSGWGFIQQFDKDNDGKVSRAEFPGSDHKFKDLDKNKDSYIDEGEAPKRPPSGMRKGVGFIGRFDKNNDGRVSRKEFPGSDHKFKHLDKNKDSYIDEGEAPRRPRPHGRRSGSFMQKFEEDNDGKVSRAEFLGADERFNRHDENQDGYIIGEKHIQKDIIGKSIEGWTFEKGAPCRIEILDAKYEKDTAVVHVSIKAVKHVRRTPGWMGKQGKLRLGYEYAENDWNLVNIKAASLSELAINDAYAVWKTAGHPLLVAADEGDVEMVRTLLDKGADLEVRARRGGETVLMIAAARGYVDVAKILVENGADVYATSGAGLTALMVAARARQAQMVRYLLDKGADANCKGPLGSTALLLATEGRAGDLSVSDKDLVSIVSALVDKGANVNARDDRGLTALWFALREGKEAVIKVLLDKGADVNMVAGKAGLTPLMEAVAMGCPSIVKILLENGAEVNAKKNGVTALDIAKTSRARANKKIVLIEILKKAGAKE